MISTSRHHRGGQRYVTLEPGDLLATGLRPASDRIQAAAFLAPRRRPHHIAGIGELTNPCLTIVVSLIACEMSLLRVAQWREYRNRLPHFACTGRLLALRRDSIPPTTSIHPTRESTYGRSTWKTNDWFVSE